MNSSNDKRDEAVRLGADPAKLREEALLLPGLREALKWKPNTPQLENAMTYAWEAALKSFIRAIEANAPVTPSHVGSNPHLRELADRYSTPSSTTRGTLTDQRIEELRAVILADRENWASKAYGDEINALCDMARFAPRITGVDKGRPGGDYTAYVCSCGQVRVETDGRCARADCPIPVTSSASGEQKNGG